MVFGYVYVNGQSDVKPVVVVDVSVDDYVNMPMTEEWEPIDLRGTVLTMSLIGTSLMVVGNSFDVGGMSVFGGMVLVATIPIYIISNNRINSGVKFRGYE
tara:strand:- start:5268 stop:5567 length:300 start_codon:yes stop_codon:yes gene_type:complete